jgi:hypothetical protein
LHFLAHRRQQEGTVLTRPQVQLLPLNSLNVQQLFIFLYFRSEKQKHGYSCYPQAFPVATNDVDFDKKCVSVQVDGRIIHLKGQGHEIEFKFAVSFFKG